MTDIVDKATRSRMMSGIRGRNTKPEMLIRSGLHRRGFRFRLHVRNLPGRPDIVLPKHRAIIEVRGCFWHAHGCGLSKIPSTREEFWEYKLASNRVRDLRNERTLSDLGWRVVVVWECAIRGPGSRSVDQVVDEIADLLLHGSSSLTEIGA